MNVSRVESLPSDIKFDRKAYWKLPTQDRYLIWANIVSKGLGISKKEALMKIYHNNFYPVSERVQDHFAYPRLNENASLLAQASADFQGPRGKRPRLASLINILMMSGLTHRQAIVAHRTLRYSEWD